MLLLACGSASPHETQPQNCPYPLVSLDEAFRQADILTLHTPLTEQTAGMVNARRLSTMKPTALLVNTARGGLIVEADLAQALQKGVIAGAALDVLTENPWELRRCSGWKTAR